MDFELFQRVRVVDRQSPFHDYIGTIEQVDAEQQRLVVRGRFKGWSPIEIYVTFRKDQLAREDRRCID